MPISLGNLFPGQVRHACGVKVKKKNKQTEEKKKNTNGTLRHCYKCFVYFWYNNLHHEIKFSGLEPENSTRNVYSTGILHCNFLGFAEGKSWNIQSVLLLPAVAEIPVCIASQ